MSGQTEGPSTRGWGNTRESRDSECKSRALQRRADAVLKLRPESEEAKIRAQLFTKGKASRALVEERLAFANHMLEQGFDRLQGTRFQSRTEERAMIGEADYLCEKDLLDAVKGDVERAKNIMSKALADGEGVGMGYFTCPHENVRVYRHYKPFEMRDAFTKSATLRTEEGTGEIHAGTATAAPANAPLALQPPAPILALGDGSPQTPNPVPSAATASQPASPATANLSMPATPAVQPPTPTAPVLPPSKPPQLPTTIPASKLQPPPTELTSTPDGISTSSSSNDTMPKPAETQPEETQAMFEDLADLTKEDNVCDMSENGSAKETNPSEGRKRAAPETDQEDIDGLMLKLNRLTKEVLMNGGPFMVGFVSMLQEATKTMNLTRRVLQVVDGDSF